MPLFRDRIKLKHFLQRIIKYQESYKLLDNALNKPDITASEVECIYKQKNHIAEEVARFVLNKNITVEILNNELLEG